MKFASIDFRESVQRQSLSLSANKDKEEEEQGTDMQTCMVSAHIPEAQLYQLRHPEPNAMAQH